jgi:hypothetical protein
VECLGIHLNCDNSCNVDDVDGNNPVKELGELKEAIVFDRILDDPSRLEVSAYLAHKWGIHKEGCLMVGKKKLMIGIIQNENQDSSKRPIYPEK